METDRILKEMEYEIRILERVTKTWHSGNVMACIINLRTLIEKLKGGDKDA